MRLSLRPLLCILVGFFLTGTLFAETPQRIVSLTPCATDLLSELGIRHELVGITRYCKPPPETRPQIIGGLIDPSPEKILTLKPDLLIHANVHDKSFLVRMAKHGIPYITLFPESYENIKRDVALLGEKTQRQPQAAAILKKWKDAETSVIRRRTLKKQTHKPRVLIAWGEVFAGPKSYLHPMIELCGGINAVSAETERAWTTLSKEQLLACRAEILICVTPDGPAQITKSPKLAETLKKNPGFRLLPALRNKNIFQINENSRLLYPSPALIRALPQLADAIHGN